MRLRALFTYFALSRNLYFGIAVKEGVKSDRVLNY